MKVQRMVAVMVGVCGIAIVGCGSSGSSGSSGTSAQTSKQTYNVGLVLFASADETSSAAIKGYAEYATSKGWSTTTIDAQGSAEKAIAAMQNLLQKKVNLIVTTVFPAEGLAAGALAAKAAGVPVLSLGGGTGGGVQVSYDAGKTQGKMIAEKMVEETGGKGRLLVLGYKSGLPCIEREEELNAAKTGKSYEVTRDEIAIPGAVESGTKFTQAWLAKNPSNGQDMTIWACTDESALGAISAIKQVARKGIRIYGINGEPAALKAVENGEMTATVYLDAAGAGRQMAEHTPEYVAAGANATPINTPVPSVLVDKSTIAEVHQKYPQAFSGK